jgi:uncharacterized delta-60 repeat protein
MRYNFLCRRDHSRTAIRQCCSKTLRNIKLEDLEQRRLLSAGDVDVTFGGGDGRQLYDQTTSTDLVALPDGRLLAAAPTKATSGSSAGLELRRYNADGSPDAMFGPGGAKLLSLGKSAIVDLTLLAGGKILAVGGIGSTLWSDQKFIARFNANGTPDATFGGGDGILFGFGGPGALAHAALLSDGRFVAASGDQVYRFHADGSLDSSFGKSGVATVTLPDPQNGTSPLGTLGIADLALAPGNTIVVSGEGTNHHYAAVARLTSTGALDAAFNATDHGYVYYYDPAENEGASALAVLSDGRVVIGIHDEDGVFRIHRLTAAGAADATFGAGSGQIGGAFGVVGGGESATVDDLLIQPDGKIVIMGSAHRHIEENIPDTGAESVDFSIQRFNADGSTDQSFNTGKPAKADFTELNGDRTDVPEPSIYGPVIGSQLVRTPDGDFVLAGTSVRSDPTLPASQQQMRFALARFQGTDAGPSGKIPFVHDVQGIVRVTGTESADNIAIRQSRNVVLLQFNGNIQRIDPSATFGYAIDGRGGADMIYCDGRPQSDQPNTLIGGTGNDSITGGPQPDLLQGGDGNDLLDGGTGNNVFQGGAGSDTADYSRRATAVRISLNDQADDVTPATGETDNVRSDVETVLGGAGNDLLVGSAAANLLVGNGGKDSLIGNEGADVLRGGSGDDRLDGENGKEFQLGKPLSSDQLFGDAGIDTADYSHRGTALTLKLDNVANDGAAGENDNIHADVENILGGSGNDLIVGGPFANSLVGNAGNDIIWGGEGNDTLVGGTGTDQLFGQGGNDLLLAREGQKDRVDGGPGIDTAQRDNSETVADVIFNIETFI